MRAQIGRRVRRHGLTRSADAAAGSTPASVVSAVLPVARIAATAAAVAAIALGQTPAPARAAGGAGVTFAESFDRARLVVVATVDEAPPTDAGYRLDVEEVVKGAEATELAFPADATSLTLVRGSHVVVLAMDPRSLDFRGTWALSVAPDGSIDPDGMTGAPATVDDLLATYAATSPSPASSHAAGATSPISTGSDDAAATGSGVGVGTGVAGAAIVVAACLAVGVALMASAGRRGRRGRRG